MGGKALDPGVALKMVLVGHLRKNSFLPKHTDLLCPAFKSFQPLA